jgi:hypothetical protein
MHPVMEYIIATKNRGLEIKPNMSWNGEPDLSRLHSTNTGITDHREPTEAITDEEDDDDDELYAGSHSSKDTVLRADSISSEEQEELQELETQGIIEVFHARYAT